MGSRKRPLSVARLVGYTVVTGGIALGGVLLFNAVGHRSVESTAVASSAATIETAKKFVDEGKTAEARDLLSQIAARGKKDASAPAALMLMAKLDQAEGKTDQAIAGLHKAATEFPDSPNRPEAALAYARLIENAGNTDEALAIYKEIQNSAPPEIRARALTGLGSDAERRKDLLAARDLYERACADSPWNSEGWNEALDALGRTNVALIFAPAATPDSKTYTVGKRDNLNVIGIKLNTTQGLLMKANGVNENTVLQQGQTLKYTPKDFHIVIERSTCRLFLLDKKGVFKRYSTGLGMPGHETALGSFKIGDKQKDPIWHKPGEGPIPAGDPRNELGTRWMPLVPVVEGLPTDLGIHGTIAPETIGKFASHGCARLHKEDIEELYDLVVRSTPVDIVDVYDPKGTTQNADSSRPT
ncbi:MAG: tetratricopeptide repeat protein [Candidatus Hydrogenedentes bacterium]|nr:tetratricopeptide repeat protein [Candidatus Hydrogenedentota bacterium]